MESIKKAEEALDHLLLGIADLDEGIDWVHRQTGVRAAMGGRHPGAGTRNALLSLNDHQYLEILALDPEQKQGGWMADMVQNAGKPRLVAWAVAVPEIISVLRNAVVFGYRVEGPAEGSRLTLLGKKLSWKTARIRCNFGAVIPFFIEWGQGIEHPSQSSPAGCRLQRLEFIHPEADRVGEMLASLGLAAAVHQGTEPRITALLHTPRGEIRI